MATNLYVNFFILSFNFLHLFFEIEFLIQISQQMRTSNLLKEEKHKKVSKISFRWQNTRQKQSVSTLENSIYQPRRIPTEQIAYNIKSNSKHLTVPCHTYICKKFFFVFLFFLISSRIMTPLGHFVFLCQRKGVYYKFICCRLYSLKNMCVRF